MTEDEKKFVDAQPTAVWWKRLPVIRHIRAIHLSWCLARHYSFWESVGSIGYNAHLDYAVRDAIWRGEK
jgi:hypothetical protein